MNRYICIGLLFAIGILTGISMWYINSTCNKANGVLVKGVLGYECINR